MSEQGSKQDARKEAKQGPAQEPVEEDKQNRAQGLNKLKEIDPHRSAEKLTQDSKEDSKEAYGRHSKQDPKRAQKKPAVLGPKPTPVKKQNIEKDGEDLTTILDESQRADLTLLIADATESMRKLIVENFNACAGLSKALLRENMTEDEKLMSTDVDPGTADVAALDRERKLKEQYEREISSVKMKDLKRNALEAFDGWRETVIERVGQVVNSERTAKGQLVKDAKAGKAQPQAPDHSNPKNVEKKSANQGITLKFKDLYPPTKTSLTKLSMQQRTLILHSMLLLLLSLEHYNALSRVLLLHLTSSLKLPLKTFEQDETTVAKGLLEAAKELTADEETKRKAEANSESRKWRVGLATAAGAAVIGISGGMAAPLVSAGVGTIMGSLGLGATAAAGYLGSVAGSAVIVGGLFGAYGGRMTGQMMDHYAREVEDFEFLPVHSRNRTSEKEEEGAQQATDHNHKLRITICISGWLTEKDEVVSPWKVIGRGAEVFALKWELEALLNLGNAMNGLVQSAAWGYAQKQLIQQTVFADLMAAMWPIGLMKAAGVIDNPFSVAKARAEKAGEVLADALINRAQGERPVTLIGYSLGARVIYTCLMSLAQRKAFGLIENAVLIGAPTPSDTTDWRTMRTAVSARLVNVYSENDYVLGFMYRTSSVQYGVAGLQKVEGLSGVENVNVSEDVKGHLRYRYLIGSILKRMSFGDIDMQAIEEEHMALEKMEQEEKENSLRAQKNRLLRSQSSDGKEDEAEEAEKEANEIQKEVAAKTRKSLVTRVVEYLYLPKTPSAKDIEKNFANIRKATADPSEAGNVAIEAVKDIQSSGQSYAQWATEKLAHFPGRGDAPTKVAKGPFNPGTAPADTALETAGDGVATAQSYTQTAARYLPSFGGGSKNSSKDLEKAARDGAKGAEDATNLTPVVSTVKETAKPTLDHGSDNAASSGKDAVEGAEKNAEEAVDRTPAIVAEDPAMPTLPKASKMAENVTEGDIEAAFESASQDQEVAGNAAETAHKSTSDAAPSVGRRVDDAASSTQKAAGDTISSAQSYTQRAAGYLLTLGDGRRKKDVDKNQKDAKQARKAPTEGASDPAGNAMTTTQSYTSMAAGYLPKFGGSKGIAHDSSKPADNATKQTLKTIRDAQEQCKEAVAETTKAPSITSKNANDATQGLTEGGESSAPDAQKAAGSTASSGQGYASRAAGYLPRLPSISSRVKPSAPTDTKRKPSGVERTESPKAPPIIHQDSTPSSRKGSENDASQLAHSEEYKAKDEDRSYTSRASKFLPSVPSLPGLGRGKSGTKPEPPAQDCAPSESKKKPAKLERRTSGASKAVPRPERKAIHAMKLAPKLEKEDSEAAEPGEAAEADKPDAKLERQASGVKKSIPKLSRKPSRADTPAAAKPEETPSGAQKSIPKLARKPTGADPPPAKPERTRSGAQKSPPKLARTQSGMNPPSGQLGSSTPSEVQSPPAKLGRAASGVKSKAPKLDRAQSGVPHATLRKGVSDPASALGGRS